MSLKQKSNKGKENVSGLCAVMLKVRAVTILLMKKSCERQVELQALYLGETYVD